MVQKPIKLFLSYSRYDESFREKIEKYLVRLKKSGLIQIWFDRNLRADEEWESEIIKHLNTAEIILLLISLEFVNSEYCCDIELPIAMQRHDVGGACVIPIRLNPIEGWAEYPFSKLQAYPSLRETLSELGEQAQSRAYVTIADAIRETVERLLEGDLQETTTPKEPNEENLGWERELRTCEEKLIANPNSEPLWREKAAILEKLDRFKEASESYRKALEIKPENFKTWSQQGAALSMAGKPEKALVSYDKATDLEEGDYKVWRKKGLVLAVLGIWDEALDCHNKALAIEHSAPDSYILLSEKGAILHVLNLVKEAIDSYSCSIKIEPSYRAAKYEQRRAYKSLYDKRVKKTP
jgi:tetratricopeptide (TPR) repeat protein